MYPLTLTFLFFIFTTLISALPTDPLSVAAAPVRPPKGSASLSTLSVDLDGNGCAPNSVSVMLASDNSALTIIFDNFSAADGPKAGTASTRAFCRVNIGMSSPGWAFDVQSADFRGYVYIEKGVQASLVSRWKWIDAQGVDLKGKVCQTEFPFPSSSFPSCADEVSTNVRAIGQHPEEDLGTVRRRLLTA
jgi:hypothetical protein